MIKTRQMNRRHTMIPSHIEKKNREMIGNNGRNTPPSFHRPLRLVQYYIKEDS